jgi:hypothetical protein
VLRVQTDLDQSLQESDLRVGGFVVWMESTKELLSVASKQMSGLKGTWCGEPALAP